MASDQNHQRRRTAVALVLAGIGLMLVAVYVVCDHQYEMELAKEQPHADTPDYSIAVVRMIRYLTYTLIVLVLIFAVSLLALRRWSKAYKARLLRRPRRPTPVDDVWSMHRDPEPSADETD